MNLTDSESPVMTVKEAAKALGVNAKTLYAEIAAGRFPAIRLGRVLRVARHGLASVLEQGCLAPLGGRNRGHPKSAKP